MVVNCIQYSADFYRLLSAVTALHNKIGCNFEELEEFLPAIKSVQVKTAKFD